MGYGQQVLDEFREPLQDLRRRIPAVFEGYGSLYAAAFADGALDGKTKELIALAIGVVHRCDGCIASHARASVRKGATADEAAEAIGVAILMNGGPATVYGPKAMGAFLEFAADLAPVASAG